VVVTLTVTLLPGAAEVGETAQVDSEGAPVQLKVTAWLNPPSPPTLNVKLAICPGETVCDDDAPEARPSVKSSPVPFRFTVCVLPAAPLLLSDIVRVPVRVPPAVGVNVTSMAQEPPAATLLPQLLVWLKSSLMPMLLTASAIVPVFLSVTVCAADVVPIS
jgi:hypothetical protein